jgi:hypothetical protein
LGTELRKRRAEKGFKLSDGRFHGRTLSEQLFSLVFSMASSFAYKKTPFSRHRYR